MPPITPRHLAILTAICNLPTAPYCEQHVIAWLLQWAQLHKQHINTRRDKAGNVYLEYLKGKRSRSPLVIEAHMDHPGFVLQKQKPDGTLLAQFRGGVKPSLFQKTTAQFWLPDPTPLPNTKYPLPPSPRGKWIPAKVISTAKQKKEDFLPVTLQLKIENGGGRKLEMPPNTLGMWHLPDAKVHGDLFSARVCDDLAGVAAIVCLLENLITKKINTHILALCSRAEEVGFAGVLAACTHKSLPKNSPIIGLETSKGSAHAPQGAGPVIRVGDRTGLFSPGLTHFITQAAGHIADDAPAKKPFLYQRKLMDGGTCNSTAFAAFGYDSAAMCVALGNYHNQHIKGDAGYGNGAKAGPGIASETINLRDFEGLVQILIQTAKRIPTYQPGFKSVKTRLTTLHQKQIPLLYNPLPKP